MPSEDKELSPGLILRLKDHEKYSNIGYKDDLAILLSIDYDNMHKKDLYKIGVFWWSGNGEEVGGARVRDFYKETIDEIFEVIGTINRPTESKPQDPRVTVDDICPICEQPECSCSQDPCCGVEEIDEDDITHRLCQAHMKGQFNAGCKEPSWSNALADCQESVKEFMRHFTTPKCCGDLEKVIKFLLGESELDGYSFGEYRQGRPKFWWRNHLRKAWESCGVEEIDEEKVISFLKEETELGNELQPIMLKDFAKRLCNHFTTPKCTKCDEYKTKLEAWFTAFGTTQLTHALARLKVAEKSTPKCCGDLVEEFKKEFKGLRILPESVYRTIVSWLKTHRCCEKKIVLPEKKNCPVMHPDTADFRNGKLHGFDEAIDEIKELNQ